jgi:hypothetical protein
MAETVFATLTPTKMANGHTPRFVADLVAPIG